MPYKEPGSKTVCNPCCFSEGRFVCTNSKNFGHEHLPTAMHAGSMELWTKTFPDITDEKQLFP